MITIKPKATALDTAPAGGPASGASVPNVSKTHKAVVGAFPVVKKADTAIVVNDNLHWEDQFIGMYWSSTAPNNPLILPPFNPEVLMALATRNNVLGQCIEVMEVNIDGTGHDITAVDEGDPMAKWQERNDAAKAKAAFDADQQNHQQEQSFNQTQSTVMGQKPPPVKPKPVMEEPPPAPKDPEQEMLESFFKMPWPGESMIMLRRKLRYEMETTGNGYLEVLRNLDGEVVFLRVLDSTTMRLVKLDAPVAVEKKVVRNGKEMSVTIQARERRFAQKIVEKLIYFKEFGASRNINRNTGAFETPDNPIPPELLGTEILHFTIVRDIKTSYGLPRWINNLPSVIGSRKAEEFNLEFFDSGGVPPAAVFVAGGAMGDDVTEQLLQYFSGQAKNKHRVAVVQIQSTSGTIDGGGKVEVKTERFGDTKGDAMFQNYDTETADHVREAFRIPPIFLGKSDDYNFASAMTSYMVTEAQVFEPERLEFDEVINNTVCVALGAVKFKFQSKPINLKNADLMMQALPLVQQMVKGEEFVQAVNDVAGTNFTYDQATVDEAKQQQQSELLAKQQQSAAKQGFGGGIPAEPTSGGSNPFGGSGVTKSDWSPLELITLAGKWMVASGLEEGQMKSKDRASILKQAQTLKGDHKKIFEHCVAQKMYSNASDDDGLSQVAAFVIAKNAIKKGCTDAH